MTCPVTRTIRLQSTGLVRRESSEATRYPVDGTQLNLFGPEDFVTREQFAVMIARYANILYGVNVSSDGTKLASMPDASTVSPWARASLAWALDAGVMDGREIDGTRYLDPQGSAWRSAVGKMTATLERDVLE